MDKRTDASSKAMEKKVLILEATKRLLGDRGLQAISFETIAEEAALSRQLVRYYYPNMDDLICDLCDHLRTTYMESITTGISDIGRVKRLDFFLDYFFGVSEDHPMPDNLQVYDALFAYAVGSPPLRERLSVKYYTLSQVVLHELAVAHPQLDDKAREELSFLFVSMMHAHWSFISTLRFSTQHNRTARQAFDRLIVSYVEAAKNGSAD